MDRPAKRLRRMSPGASEATALAAEVAALAGWTAHRAQVIAGVSARAAASKGGRRQRRSAGAAAARTAAAAESAAEAAYFTAQHCATKALLIRDCECGACQRDHRTFECNCRYGINSYGRDTTKPW